MPTAPTSRLSKNRKMRNKNQYTAEPRTISSSGDMLSEKSDCQSTSIECLLFESGTPYSARRPMPCRSLELVDADPVCLSQLLPQQDAMTAALLFEFAQRSIV